MITCDMYDMWSPYRVLVGNSISESGCRDHFMILDELDQVGCSGEMAAKLIISTMVSTAAIYKMMETSI